RARYQIAEGQWEAAVQTLQTGFTLARHLGEGPTFIHGLVGAAVGQLLCAQVEEFVQQPGAPNLYWALTLLPRPLINPENALAEEATMLERTFPWLQRLEDGPMSPAQVQAAVASVRKVLDDFGVRAPTAGENLAQGLLLTKLYPDAK